MLKLRPATIDDAELLFNWRNDQTTRMASHSNQPLDFNTHLVWLKNSLTNHLRKIYIVEENNKAVGTLRTDILKNTNNNTENTELSWTVAPEARGQGIAKKMLSLIIPLLSGIITAEIKKENIASIKVAEAIGMTLKAEQNGILFFELVKI